MTCPESHHECAGTERIVRVSERAGVPVRARHYLMPAEVIGGQDIPAEWTYEARGSNRCVTHFDPLVIESADGDMDEIILMELLGE